MSLIFSIGAFLGARKYFTDSVVQWNNSIAEFIIKFHCTHQFRYGIAFLMKWAVSATAAEVARLSCAQPQQPQTKYTEHLNEPRATNSIQ